MTSAPVGTERRGDPRPRVVVSECLGFAAVRYNGRVLSSDPVSRLREHVEMVPICPEVAIGLGVPRDPIMIARTDRDEERLVQPSTGRDLTAPMAAWSADFLETAGGVDGFILKSRSPSCGIDDVKRFAGGEMEPLAARGPGMFARAVIERCPEAAVTDEAALADAEHRARFLTHLFTSARFGEVRRAGGLGELTRFHAEHKFLLMARDPAAMRTLGRIAAGAADAPEMRDPIESYGQLLGAVLATPPTPGRMADALDHLRGMLSEDVTAEERARLRRRSERYRLSGDASALVDDLLATASRRGNAYVLGQRILTPFPAGLAAGPEPVDRPRR